MHHPYIDFHNHKQRKDEDTIEVISIHSDQDKEARYSTIGFHPWWTENLLDNNQLSVLEDRFLRDDGCLGIGECGLDKLKGVELDLQEEIFIQQIELANKLEAPLVVHCVRAFERVINCKKKYGLTPWVIHGFVRNKILAKQVLDASIFLSLAPHQSMNQTFVETIQYVPLNRIFIETDSEPSLNIKERYFTFTDYRKIDEFELRVQLYDNF